jgi:hypothetical protein
MADHPYTHAHSYQRWRRAVAAPPPDAIDPVVAMKFRIGREDRIVTAGSCFAQHIAGRLTRAGCNVLVTETAHPLLPQAVAERFGYGIYTARTGNIYTARQLLQLWRRANGTLHPLDDVWCQNGRFYDPFRPAIQPGGFASAREYTIDRAKHFAAVREAFATMDVLVFTLGLTECWEDAADGCVYPVCPGTLAGAFDPDRHTLLNLSVAEVLADLQQFCTEVRAANPHFRMILTVSPVPLAATALDQHVLVSTTYSKAVLRVAAGMAACDPAILYFPAYEIVTGAFARGRYFADDLRTVTASGVDHVMRVFLAHAVHDGAIEPGSGHAAPMRPQGAHSQHRPAQDGHFDRLSQAVAVLCEEEALDSAVQM